MGGGACWTNSGGAPPPRSASPPFLSGQPGSQSYHHIMPGPDDSPDEPYIAVTQSYAPPPTIPPTTVLTIRGGADPDREAVLQRILGELVELRSQQARIIAVLQGLWEKKSDELNE